MGPVFDDLGIPLHGRIGGCLDHPMRMPIVFHDHRFQVAHERRQILEIAPTIERVGFQAIDFTSSTHMAVAVRYAKDDPWERIRLMHQACPTSPLPAGFARGT